MEGQTSDMLLKLAHNNGQDSYPYSFFLSQGEIAWLAKQGLTSAGRYAAEVREESHNKAYDYAYTFGLEFFSRVESLLNQGLSLGGGEDLSWVGEFVQNCKLLNRSSNAGSTQELKFSNIRINSTENRTPFLTAQLFSSELSLFSEVDISPGKGINNLVPRFTPNTMIVDDGLPIPLCVRLAPTEEALKLRPLSIFFVNQFLYRDKVWLQEVLRPRAYMVDLQIYDEKVIIGRSFLISKQSVPGHTSRLICMKDGYQTPSKVGQQEGDVYRLLIGYEQRSSETTPGFDLGLSPQEGQL